MAEVLEGRDLRLGRRVAVKILRPDMAKDPSFQSRFRREAQSAASLNHPNVVAVYDTGEDILGDDNQTAVVPYIVMEHVDGQTLRQLVASGRRLFLSVRSKSPPGSWRHWTTHIGTELFTETSSRRTSC